MLLEAPDREDRAPGVPRFLLRCCRGGQAIAGAVIGGTSLFGGRGSAWSALLGALVIGSVSNGLDLMAQPPEVKYMVEGAILLAAVTVDAPARRSRRAVGDSRLGGGGLQRGRAGGASAEQRCVPCLLRPGR